jgi:hypothetical protein
VGKGAALKGMWPGASLLESVGGLEDGPVLREGKEIVGASAANRYKQRPGVRRDNEMAWIRSGEREWLLG